MQPSQSEIDDVLNTCMEAADHGCSKWPSMSYEQGVEAAVRWMEGDGFNPLSED